MSRKVNFKVYDADHHMYDHMYEGEDAFFRYLPAEYANDWTCTGLVPVT